MGKHILVPIDGSPLSEEAFEVALSENPDAEITCLHVIDPTDPGYSYYPFDSVMDLDEEPRHGSDEWYERARDLAEELFEDAEAKAAEHDAQVSTELVVGVPSEAIVEYAQDHDVDHVIMGSHGRGEDARVTVGTVTEAVAFRSPVPVTLVR